MTKAILKWILPSVPVAMTLLALGAYSIYYFTSVAKQLPEINHRAKIVIGHDGGADDAMAIFIALQYQKYFNGPEVKALTTTYGNVDETTAFKNTQKFLNIANELKIPIYRGATASIVRSYPTDKFFGDDGLGNSENEFGYQEIEAEAEPAAVALIELSKKYQGDLIVISLGPMTNVALAAKLDPEFLSRLLHLYIGAGAIYSESYLNPEFNAMQDAEAYYAVVNGAAPEKVTAVPFSEVYKSLNISMEWRKNVLGAIPTKMMKAMNRFEQVVWKKLDHFIYLDPVVVAAVVNTSFVEETKKSKNSIILCGEKRGINTNKLDDTKSNVNLIYTMNVDKYKEFLVYVFSASLY